VIAIEHASKLVKDKSYEQAARRGGFTVNAIDEAQVLARKIPGISDETLSRACCPHRRRFPTSISTPSDCNGYWSRRRKCRRPRRASLPASSTRTRPRLGLDDGCATKIEPAPTDKDAFVMAHESAAEYINDDTKSFMDRYSDMLYLGAAALSVIGSIFAGALRQGHPDRTGTGQRAHHSDPRHRPEDRARAFAGRA
jgi:hypothetical protein